jgi:hypothetical protein
MNAPAWLSNLLSILMIALACYALWRLLIARAWGRAVDYEADALHLVAAIAAAGLISSWAHTLPRTAWLVVFAAAGVYFAVKAATGWADGSARWRFTGAFACCAVLVYAFAAGVAPSTLHGSTAGQYTMAGMPGMYMDQTEHFPALGLALVVALAFGAVVAVNRVGSTPPVKPLQSAGRPTGRRSRSHPAASRHAASCCCWCSPMRFWPRWSESGTGGQAGS